MASPLHADLRIDPACPWAWLASRWLEEVVRVRPVHRRIRPLSIFRVNRREDEAPTERQAQSEAALEVLMAARLTEGDEALARVYTEIGEAHHERGQELDARLLGRAVAAAGLDPALAERARHIPEVAQALAAEHASAVTSGAFGVPTLAIEGCPAFFGPVIDRGVSGETAGELWDHLVWTLSQPYLYELKRTRTGQPQVRRHAHPAAA